MGKQTGGLYSKNKAGEVTLVEQTQAGGIKPEKEKAAEEAPARKKAPAKKAAPRAKRGKQS